jgi:hypothetical protein
LPLKRPLASQHCVAALPSTLTRGGALEQRRRVQDRTPRLDDGGHLAAISTSLDIATAEVLMSFESIAASFRLSSPNNVEPGCP